MFKHPLAAALLLLVPLTFVIASCSDVLGVNFGAAYLGQDASADNADGAAAALNGDACQPLTCAAQGFQCGTQEDGCGNALECGPCATGACTGGKCDCVPKTCPELNAQCGKLDDGCGGLLDCGACANSADSCDATSNTCACEPKTCADQNATCGTVPDGCGNTYACTPGCSNPTPNCNAGTCSATVCTPKTCASLGKNCGQVSDGCGNVLTCTPGCTGTQTCGGGGVANVCGCTAKTCAQLGANCGTPADGCGGALSCGTTCASPNTCGGGGTQDVCGCTPTGKCPVGTNCGTVPNGCGGNTACGTTCASPNTCGGSGVANECGCTAKTCADFTCGNDLPNGCGGILDCGICGGGGGGGCFAEETPVLMADGSMRAIASLKPGDMIMGYDAATGETVARPVARVLVHPAEVSLDGMVLIDGDIRATRNHPILSGGHAVRAENLRAGDAMHMAESRVSAGHVDLHIGHVKSVSIVSGGILSYDVKTKPAGGYIVGHGLVVALEKE